MLSFTIGLDIGGTNIRCVKLSASNEIICEAHQPLPDNLKDLILVVTDLIVECVFGESRDVIKSTDSVTDEFEVSDARGDNAGSVNDSAVSEITIGIGCAGTVTPDGTIVNSPNILYLDGVNLKDEISAALQKRNKSKNKLPNKLPNEPPNKLAGNKLSNPAVENPNNTLIKSVVVKNLVIENDVFTATTAELRFGKDVNDDFIFIAFGTGIGAGRVIDGKQYRGANNFFGEVGHTVVTERQDLPVCGCGRVGCFEQMASSVAIPRMIAEMSQHIPKGATVEDISNLASGLKSNNLKTDLTKSLSLSTEKVDRQTQKEESKSKNASHEAFEIIDVLTDWMVVGLKNIAKICDPGLIVLSGGLMNGIILETLQEKIAKFEAAEFPPIKLAIHNQLGGAIGAALLAGLSNQN